MPYLLFSIISFQKYSTLIIVLEKKKIFYKVAYRYACCCISLFIGLLCYGQQAVHPLSFSNLNNALTTNAAFLQNVGQYGNSLEGHPEMGSLLYGYEGLDMPVLFTSKGVIYLQRKIEKLPHSEEEKLEKQGLPEEEIERRKKVTERVITMEWEGANPYAQIMAEDKTTDYHTYGKLAEKAFGFKRLIFKNIYPGIDIIYTCGLPSKSGYEFSIVAKPGADLNAVKMKFGGDVKKITTGQNGSLVVSSDINGVEISLPVSYYGDDLKAQHPNEIAADYAITDNKASFHFAKAYDTTKAIVIDPFVTATTNLIGLNAGKAKDVDFDYAGNIYVTGGGTGDQYLLAKYNAAGALLWTFNGALTIPSWKFGPYYGGWVVEKPTGNVYLGQGFNFTQGFIVVRIHTSGLYDNYVTTGNPNFRENWKMIWNCNNGSPQILIAGGGTNSNINMGICTPPSVNLSSTNITGIAGDAYQDMADMVIDPVTNSMYTTYAAGLTPSLNNAILKHNAPYSSASMVWQVQSGFPVLQEAANRPYMAVNCCGLQDNSVNMLAVNASYLFYWNGKDLKAIDKSSGATIGAPLTIAANVAKMQGGIVADACNNIFVGSTGGTIKVYKFTGAVFDDAAAADITIPGFSTKSVYDLAYNETQKLLYASGDGFVASLDVSAYCPVTAYTLNVVPDCLTATATASLTPAPFAGSTVTYTLYIGATLIATNTTGIFSGLSPKITYTIIATVNQNCSGVQTTVDFTIPAPDIAETHTNTTCGQTTGSISATGSGTVGSYTYNINGGAFQASGTFVGLAAGVYTIGVKDGNGCPNKMVVTIVNTNGPALTYTSTNATCGLNTGTITANATGGTTPYLYSINGVTYQSNNFFTGLLPGTYTLTIKDAKGCLNAALVTITTSSAIFLSAIPASTTCDLPNGAVTAFGSGGTPPFQYSINGNTFQVSNVFSGLTPGTYTVTVKDAIGCIKTTTVTVGNSPAPTVTATSTPAACSNVNGTITATGSGGIVPLQYSINGTTFQASNVFTGLGAGNYTITVQDATGCTGIVTVNVLSTGGPTVTAISTPSSCSGNTGSITATASGTVGAYQYSLNGITFQFSNTFSGLASGNYVVLGKDGNGCIGTVSIVVGSIAGPSVTAVATPTACNTNNGTITATGTGGGGGYQYSVDGTTYQPGNVFTGLATGVYTVYVKDANNCIQTTTITVVNVSGLSLAVSTITSSCNTNNGVITATATGGIAPLQYSLNGTTYQASNTFTGLAAGSYVVYVKDASGCVVTKPATVLVLNGPSLTVFSPFGATCGGANGVIIASGSGGVAPLTYSINGTSYQVSDTFYTVSAGTYTVYVKDATGCIATQTITITNTSAGTAITTFTVVTKYYPCNGNVGGKITNPRVNGANCGGCSFSLDFGPFIPNNTQLYLGVPPGIHYVTAMNASGCTKTIVVNLAPTPLSTGTTVVTGTACNTSNGKIVLTGIGVNTPFHASINGGATWITFDPSTTFTGLAPGIYTILMADDESFDIGPPIIPGGCITTLTVVVPSIGGPTISTIKTPGTCGIANGIITASGNVGAPPYTFNINGGSYQTIGIFSGLASGIYTIRVKDNVGCINIKTDTLVNASGPVITAITAAASCNQPNGTITATVTGGTAPYLYSIDGFTFLSSNVFTGLAAGNYTIAVKDALLCYSTLVVNVANTTLPKATAYTVAASCNNNDGSIIVAGSAGTAPYVFSIDGAVYQSSGIFGNVAAGFYTVYIKDASGCIKTTGVNVGNIGVPVITLAATSASCNNPDGTITVTVTGGPYQYSKDGITFQGSNIFTALLPGSYTITIKDGNGCIATKSIVVGNTNGPQTLTATHTDASCGLSNGSITATASGGLAPLQYSVNGTVYQLSTFFGGLASGGYTLYVKDAKGCIKTLPVTLANLAAPTLSATSSPSSCTANDGTITATAFGGTLPLTYSKNGVTFQAVNIFTGLAPGPYTITVKDAKGCTATFNIAVPIIGSTVTPTFNAVAPICAGQPLAPLPTNSIENIVGTWLPALDNTTTTTYTFTPNAGQCATTQTLTITVKPKPLPNIIYHN